MGPNLLTAFMAVALPLGVTVCIETAVAALFGLRGQSLGAVVWVNFVTNPLLNLVWLGLFWFGVGYTTTPSELPGGGAGRVSVSAWMWLVLALLEVAVVFAEWVILLRVVERKAMSARRLLTLCIVMNVMSATLGTFLLVRFA
jgi:hypothetical protein